MKLIHSSWKFLRLKQCCVQILKFKSTFLKTYSSEEVRSTFINYFQNKYDHKFIPSSKVYSGVDDSLLFVNAGMNQFKPILLGISESHEEFGVIHRAVNSQRCIRVGGKHNDLEVVGKDCYHHTLFEMLGSWSFGDYFKKGACEMAWKLLTEVFKLPISNLYVTYFGGSEKMNLDPDLETKEIWLSIGVPDDRIFPFGPKFNFWEMGDVGPCGPCTEIHYDQIGNRYIPEAVNVDGSGVIEIWNLVFTQYNRINENHLELLEKFHVDTGMGLERITAVLQEKLSNYDTDLFQPIIAKLEDMADCKLYEGNVGATDQDGIDSAYRVISDHIRMLTIAIADGVLPGPKNRDMIVRRVLRRAVKVGSEKLKLPHLFLGKLVPVVVEKLKDAYPNLIAKQSYIIDVIDNAEQEYYDLISKGDDIFKRTISNMNQLEELFPTKTAVLLLSDLGYPRERFFDQLKVYNKIIDTAKVDRFFHEKNLKRHPAKSNELIKGQELKQVFLQSLSVTKPKKTDALLKSQYRKADTDLVFETMPVKVLLIFDENGKVLLNTEADHRHVYMLFDKTCFIHPYGHFSSSSVGGISFSNEAVASVDEVINVQNWILHRVAPLQGYFKCISVGDVINLTVNSEQWLPHVRVFNAAAIVHNVLGDIASGNEIQKFKYEPDKLKIEVSGVVNVDDVLKLEKAVNDIISGLSCGKEPNFSHSRKVQEFDFVALLPQDIAKFVVVTHKLQGKSRTILRCLTGTRAEACAAAAHDLQVCLDNVMNLHEQLSQKDIEAVNDLINQTGSLTLAVNKAEINFYTKAEYRKSLRNLSGRLNTMRRKMSKQKSK